MDWLSIIQNAIADIDSNLCNDISADVYRCSWMVWSD